MFHFSPRIEDRHNQRARRWLRPKDPGRAGGERSGENPSLYWEVVLEDSPSGRGGPASPVEREDDQNGEPI